MYTEYTSVEKPLLNTLTKLGWSFISPATLEAGSRDVYDHIVPFLFEESFLRINPSLSPSDAKNILEKLKRVENDEEFYEWLLGERTYKPAIDEHSVSIHLIDTDDIHNNSFHCTNQYKTAATHPDNAEKHIKPDVVLLVNGIPLTIVECKTLSTENSTWEDGIKQIDRYIRTTPNLFKYNTFNITTDGFTYKYGATRSPKNYFMEWKNDKDKEVPIEADSEFQKFNAGREKEYNPFIDRQIYRMLNPETYLDIVRNFIAYEKEETVTIKKICRYQQYRAANKIIHRVVSGEQKTGLIWHTQGSGKSLTMLFAAKKMRNTEALNNPTILIVVDRVDLDTQISGTMSRIGLKNATSAGSISALKKKLSSGTREIIVTTVFKFQDIKKAVDDRDNIIILIDEAHRTQEGDVSANMRAALPNAYIFGFTGTPIDKNDKNTHRNFGYNPNTGKIERYMDLYNIKDAIDDGATKPVHYMLRNRKWFISQRDIDQVIATTLGHLNQEELDAVKEKASRYETFMLKPERLDYIALDIFKHYTQSIEPKGFKAQLVCISRKGCVLLKDRLDEYLGPEVSEIIFSTSPNDEVELKKHAKTKDEVKTIIKRFKKKDDPIKILIVQNMLLTGFDAPIEQVMYLDRPLKDHNLLQAIARTNRPYPNKKCGIIVDYCGVLKNLNKALNFDETEVEDCLIDFQRLKEDLPRQIEEFKALLKGANISNLPQTIEYIEKNELVEDVKSKFSEAQLSYETICPDSFVVPYQTDYQWMVKLITALNRHLNQSDVNIDEYLPFTKQLIQDSVDLTTVNESIPVFKVDDNYLSKLDGTPMSKEMKELTLEHRLRSVLRVKIGELPVYKTLLERLEGIISRKNEESADTLHLLTELHESYMRAKKEDEAHSEKKGIRAIKQILEDRVVEEHRNDVAVEIDELLQKLVDRKEWYNQASVVANIQRELIKFLAINSGEDKRINIQPDELSGYAKELLKYIEVHYR